MDCRNVTDKKFPGDPTRSYRTREQVEIEAELERRVGLSPDRLQAIRDCLADLQGRRLAVSYD
ncbi:MAG: NAD(+)--rifampin ADP-ribosyltransferase [Candidatus Saccharibacteria bacterium]|nr:NAD(+)--rifampin ADP-ribosyltransferase [Microbacteriaceae bacterium]